jgi:hypothetical protein
VGSEPWLFSRRSIRPGVNWRQGASGGDRASVTSSADGSAREHSHNATVTRAFRHSGGHAGPFGRVTAYVGCLVSSMVWVPATTRMVTLAGVKSGKDTGQVPVAEPQVALLVDPSGAVTATVTGACPGAPVTSTTKPVQPISVQALGPATSHPEPKAATNTRAIASPSREIVTDRILAWHGAPERSLQNAPHSLNIHDTLGPPGPPAP